MKLVTLKTFDDIVDLHIMKTKLEDIGITTYIFDEHINSLNKFNTNITGGYRLQISEKDLESALTFLTLENANIEKTTCPSCSSINIEKQKQKFWSFKTILSVFAILINMSDLPVNRDLSKVCKDCGYEF